MKLIEKIKEIWKQNKWEYLISGMVVTLGCLLFYVKNRAPLEYTIPFAWLGLGIFMFTFGFFIGGNE